MSYKFSEIKIEELPPQRVICCRAISKEPEEESYRPRPRPGWPSTD